MVWIFSFLFISFFSILSFTLGFGKFRHVLALLNNLTIAITFDSFIYIMVYKYSFLVNFGEWFQIEGLYSSWELMFSPLTVALSFTIVFIASNIIIYSLNYMQLDINSMKFISLISLFTFFMLIGVTGNNLFQVLIGWEGVGIMSYLLINFYDNRVEANRSGIKALLVNKVGDIGFLLGVITSYNLFTSVKLNIINYLAYYFKNETILLLFFKIEINYLTIVTGCFLLGASAKSAQLFFNIWLPDAMEGPTPVSALIHSATMVGIGFLLLLKLSLLYQTTGYMLNIILFLGALTSILTSYGGIACYDIKSINANSTGSQLAFMFLAFGGGNFLAAFYHFTTHAFYKALLFLSSGLIIQQWKDLQDSRIITPINRRLPIASAGIIVGTYSLTAIPASLGSYSKEYIFELAYSNCYSSVGFSGWFLALLAAVSTAIYPALVLGIYQDQFLKNLKKKNLLNSLNKAQTGLSYPIVNLLLFCLLGPSYLAALFGNISLFSNPLIMNNIKTGGVDYIFTYFYIAVLPITAMALVLLGVWFKNRLLVGFLTLNYNLPSLGKGATFLYLDKLFNNAIVKSFWWNYFLLFRVISNKITHPYNFIQKLIKISCFTQTLYNRGGDYYSLLIMFLFYVTLLIYIV